MLQNRLFDRVGKRLILNDNGRVLLPQARQMLDAAAGIERQFGIYEGPTGLRLGASTTIGIYLLPALLAAVSRQDAQPDSQPPSVQIANTADIATAVENFEIDMGMIEGPCDQAEVIVEPWIQDELVVVCAPNHPIFLTVPTKNSVIGVEALSEARWLLREIGSGTRETVEHALIPHLHALREAGEFSNTEAIKHASAAGLGLACLSRLAVHDMIVAGQLVELSTALPQLHRHFYLIHNRRKILSSRLQHFIEYCRRWRPPSNSQR
jgi:DNA-binding transcriptional LysR family regulator